MEITKNSKILIIGAGTAATMSKLYLLNKGYTNIDQIAKSKTNIIGVGEATVPPVTSFLSSIGLTPDIMFKKYKSTLKMGIRFVDWCGQDILFPFNTSKVFYHALKDDMIDVNNIDNTPFAMHFDTTEFNKYNNENVIEKEITEDLKDELLLKYDMIIDASGFNQIFKTKLYHSHSAGMCINNQALVVRIPHKDTLKPYSSFIAMDSGWVWNIPLQDKLSIGYVHNDKYDVKDEFREYLKQFDYKLDEYNTVKFKNYCSSNPLRKVGNTLILNIGLSSCFIEPLQSTGLYFTVEQLNTLGDVLDKKVSIDKYNKNITTVFSNTASLIALQFKYCRKDNEYWNHYKNISNDIYNEAVLSGLFNLNDEETQNYYLLRMLKHGKNTIEYKDSVNEELVPYSEYLVNR